MTIDKKSRLLIKALRHQPDVLGLTLDERGWVSVRSVLKSLSIDKETLDFIVETNNKKRFEYSENQLNIRASQGHSIKKLEVYKDWTLFTPTDSLYHGTATHALSSILKGTLISKSRTHVHLSKDIETALNVGKRHGTPVILKIDACKMYQDGFIFYESNNGVVLVDEVPSKYITPLSFGN